MMTFDEADKELISIVTLMNDENRDATYDEACRITEAQRVLTNNAMTSEIKVNNRGKYSLIIRETIYI